MEQVDTLVQKTTIVGIPDMWFYWGLIGLVIVGIVVYFLLRKKKVLTEEELAKRKLKEQYRKVKMDGKNVMDDIFNSKPLYDALMRKFHPDRFPKDAQKRELATKLAQEITKNRTSAKRLMELKKHVEKELGLIIEN